jgi:tetratricopeptide (TPR) repeat protein
MKRIIIVITLTILTIMGLFFTNQMLLLAKSSATASDAMITANQLYETGQYLQSAQAYQQLVDQGYVDSSLYYNLGNAYFKAGDFGRAVLNFRRAEQLAPRDADIEANLELARAQAIDQLDWNPEQRGILETLTELTQEWITLDELALAALTTWLVFALLVIVVTSTTKGGLLREILQYALVVTTLVLALGIVGLRSSRLGKTGCAWPCLMESCRDGFPQVQLKLWSAQSVSHVEEPSESEEVSIERNQIIPALLKTILI